ncbi:GNAT family N-acetyltransferase [Streptomyces candidus]|uniref:Ribosomal-protein-alanine N-acetyltransferase n=1 Tax=Streptomyces candidus TaxID=67283 RepID=A0A7X0LNN1_9ACTN|nr:GNAT family protein [Streptomyces candidus]MBB6434654.1 ribosomal-protein-alanine N-acetyltransferase [Streptomyces candidus]GHH35896.1 acetyltransferase [Streptomyces candidus]
MFEPASPAPHHSAPGPRVAIRPFRLTDAEEFTARVRESRKLHGPWLAPPDTPAKFRRYAGALIDDPTRVGFLVCTRDDDRIAGFVNINNIVEGAFQNGALGYGAFAHAVGRGLLSEGLDLVLDRAFGRLGLHRLEANIQPGNEASRALVRKAHFRYEGFSPDFLFLAGAWRDHERWALTAPEYRPRIPSREPGRRDECEARAEHEARD